MLLFAMNSTVHVLNLMRDKNVGSWKVSPLGGFVRPSHNLCFEQFCKEKEVWVTLKLPYSEFDFK